MNNKWVTLVFMCFMVYSILHYPGRSNIKDTDVPMEGSKHEIIEKIHYYAEVFTADPKEYALKNKDVPLIDQPNNQEISPKEVQAPINIPPLQKDEKLGAIQTKVSNFIYNILHTEKGQDLLERALIAPRIDEDSPNKKILENPYQNNSIMNILDGEGEAAECGDIVTVHYITRLVNGQEVENTRINNKPKTFQVGDQKVIKGIEYATIGMKKSGIRRLITSPRLAYSDANFSKNLVAGNEFVTIDIELIDIKFPIPNWRDKITIFQKPDENNGVNMLCSNQVYFTYKLSTVNEKLLLKSNSIVNFIIGSTQVPAAINKAFFGIKSNSKRMVMVPSSLLYNQTVSFFPKGINLPPKETLILEINTGTSTTTPPEQLSK